VAVQQATTNRMLSTIPNVRSMLSRGASTIHALPLVFHPTITWLLLRQSLVERWWTLVLKGCQVLSIKEAVPLSVLWSVTPEACHLERAIISSFSWGWVNHLHCDLHVGTWPVKTAHFMLLWRIILPCNKKELTEQDYIKKELFPEASPCKIKAMSSSELA
jgi:hypothetical protein